MIERYAGINANMHFMQICILADEPIHKYEKSSTDEVFLWMGYRSVLCWDLQSIGPIIYGKRLTERSTYGIFMSLQSLVHIISVGGFHDTVLDS